jgi:hypothetical protein
MNYSNKFFLFWFYLPAAKPPIIVATTGVCKRGCIQAIKRNINPSEAIAYNTRGNGKSEPSNEAEIPKEKFE